MEFDQNLSKLQGTLYSLGSQGLLNKADSFYNVWQALKEIFENLSQDAISKMTFFMVINTHLSVSKDLKDDELVGLFINITPHIEKEYLILYTYYLNLQLQLFKVIENCPGALSLELLDVVVKKLKEPSFHKNEFGVDHFYQLWQSIFVKICKINAGFHVNECPRKFVCYFQDVYDLIQNILRTLMKVDGLEKFVGLHLHHFFKTILYCLTYYKNPNLSDDPIYKLSIHFKYEDSDVTENYSKHCIDLIFEKIFKIFENFTVDMWVTFSECYFDSESRNSIQTLIGDLVFNILKEVKNFDLPPNVLNCLSNLAVNKVDVMAKTDVDKIISNVRNGEKEWFEILVQHSAFTEKKTLECLLDHLDFASSEDLSVILNTSYEYLCTCDQNESSELTKKLFLTAIKKTPDWSHWLKKVFNKYQPNLLMMANTQSDIIKTFNKISKEKNIPECELICICMQSPLDTIRKVCHIALYDSQQSNFAIEILKLLKHPCEMSISENFTLLDYVLLKSVIDECADKERQSFINLVIHLGVEKFLGLSFLNNLLKNLKKYLENKMLQKAILCLEIVKAFLNLKLCHIDKAVFLVFMSQALGYLSWDLSNFEMVKVEGRDIIDQIVALIMNQLEDDNGPKSRWARREILKAWEVNQAYFCDLWFSCGRIWTGSGMFHSCILALVHSRREAEGLRKFLIRFCQSCESRPSIVLSLTVLLPVLTFREWDSVFSNLLIAWENINSEKSNFDIYQDVLDIFGSSLHFLSMKLKEDGEVYLCFEYCLRNFARLAGYYCQQLMESSLLELFEKILVILGTIEDKEKRNSCCEIFSPVLLGLIDLIKNKNIIVTNRGSVGQFLQLLDMKGVAEALNRKL